MNKLLTAVALLATFTTAAQSQALTINQPWTPEEIAAGTRIIEQTRFARAGKLIRLQPLGTFDTDCSLLTVDNGDVITKEPEHGTAYIEMGEPRFPSFNKDTPQGKNCNDKKMKFPTLLYKAAVGYSGTDSVWLTSMTLNGMVQEVRYTIKVTDPDPKGKGRADVRP